MVNGKKALIGVLVVVVVAATVTAVYLSTTGPTGPRITLSAREFSFAGEGFSGATGGPTLRVKVGDTVTIGLNNEGVIDHEFMIVTKEAHEEMVSSVEKGMTMEHPAAVFGSMVEMKPGESETLTFIADKPGEYIYACYETEPQLHAALGMFSTLIVET